jgi:tetratricopeptide (TPR) repeat protein
MTSTHVAGTAAASRLSGLSTSAIRLLEEAGRFLEKGDAHGAATALEGAAALAPDHPEVLRLYAVGRILHGRHADAIDLLRRALAIRPHDALIHNNLGSALRANGESDDAIVAFRTACELAPTLAAAWFNLGKTQKMLARTDDAQVSLERVLELAPGHVPARVVLADNLKALGRIDEAIAAYREALRLRPRSAQAWWGLANLKTRRFDAAETAALEQLFTAADLSAEDRALAGFALAKAHEDQDRYPEAWTTLQAANLLRRAQKPWDAVAFSRRVETIATAFAAPSSGPASGRGGEVIFIVSLPRSGSTLIEQILAAHPEVEGAGELPDLGIVLDEETRRRGRPFPDWAADMQAKDWERLGERYLARTRRWRAERPRFTDKGLDNWLYVGAAAAMLPAARFVYCNREPVETAVSCYRQWFNEGQHFSYALDDIARYMGDATRLMQAWSQHWPDRVYRQSLEALQDAPEEAVRELLKFAGLSFDVRCLDFHAAGRPVRTASAAQVRTPLQRDTRRAARYGESLDALRESLGATRPERSAER